MKVKSILPAGLVCLALLGALALHVKETINNEARDSLGGLFSRLCGKNGWEAESFRYDLWKRTVSIEGFSCRPEKTAPGSGAWEIALVRIESMAIERPLTPKALTRFAASPVFSERGPLALFQALRAKGLRLEALNGQNRHLVEIEELAAGGLSFSALEGDAAPGGAPYLSHLVLSSARLGKVALKPLNPEAPPFVFTAESLALFDPKFPERAEIPNPSFEDVLSGFRAGGVEIKGAALILPRALVSSGAVLLRGPLLANPPGESSPAIGGSFSRFTNLSVSFPEIPEDDDGSPASAASGTPFPQSSLPDPLGEPQYLLELESLELHDQVHRDLPPFLDSLGAALADQDPLSRLPLSLLFIPQFGFTALDFRKLSFFRGGFPLVEAEEGRLRGIFRKGEAPSCQETSLKGVELLFPPADFPLPGNFDLEYRAEINPRTGVYTLSRLQADFPGFFSADLFLALDGFSEEFMEALKTLPLSRPRAVRGLKGFGELSLIDFDLKYLDQSGFMKIVASLAQREGTATELYLDRLGEKARGFTLFRLDPFIKNADELSLSLSLFLKKPESLNLSLQALSPLPAERLFKEAPLLFSPENGNSKKDEPWDLLQRLELSLAVNGGKPLKLERREVPLAFEEDLFSGDSLQGAPENALKDPSEASPFSAF
ncbi:MAG: hypothetical protein LBR53_13275 [Deltaproteobacteria bacterium]|jgi:hypothetical protein|nr:hypothetical protein [Deltaproteobacteria bacterium]